MHDSKVGDEYDGINYYNENSVRKAENKKSGLDLSALRIPQKKTREVRLFSSLAKKSQSPRRENFSTPDRKMHMRSNSPDFNADRFGEYTRPKLREENCWGSVADFFSGKKTADKK